MALPTGGVQNLAFLAEGKPYRVAPDLPGGIEAVRSRFKVYQEEVPDLVLEVALSRALHSR